LEQKEIETKTLQKMADLDVFWFRLQQFSMSKYFRSSILNQSSRTLSGKNEREAKTLRKVKKMLRLIVAVFTIDSFTRIHQLISIT
jgi:hypothetical protein